MKTTLNPFENAKRTAQGTGGGVSPAVIEEMQAEISILGSQNKTQAQDITDIKSSLNSINDNLSGFKFYPTGTELVALVADDSFYTDENGKYVLADSATGQSMIDNVTYKALPSTEDTRGEVGADSALPFSKKNWTLILEVTAIAQTQSNSSDITQNIKIQSRNGIVSITENSSGRGPDRNTNSGAMYAYYTSRIISFTYD